jgi:co-chaperonin GroES (HSP10)
MTHAVDPKKSIRDELGDISDVEIFNNQVLCAIYVRPEKTASGIYVTQTTRDEDKIQGKVGLIIKMGPAAFVDDGQWFSGNLIFVEDEWVVFRPSDGWSVTVNGVLCRIIDDVNIRGRIQHPDQVW